MSLVKLSTFTDSFRTQNNSNEMDKLLLQESTGNIFSWFDRFEAILKYLKGPTIRIFQERPIKKFFKRKNKKKFYVICTNFSSSKVKISEKDSSGFGEIFAYGCLIETLTFCYHDMELVFEDPYLLPSDQMIGSRGNMGKNIISIGGATYNEVTRHLKKELRDNWWVEPFDEKEADKIENGNYYYKVKETGEKCKPKLKEGKDDEYEIDYGLITKWHSPINNQSTVIIIDGLHTLGLTGAGELLLPDKLKRCYETTKKFKDRKLQLLVKVEVNNDVPSIICVRCFSQSQPKDRQGFPVVFGQCRHKECPSAAYCAAVLTSS